MRTYVREPEYDGLDAVTARSKARYDAQVIMDQMSFQSFSLGAGRKDDTHGIKRILWHIHTHGLWKEKTKYLKEGDIFLIQSPCTDFEFFFPGLVKKLVKRKVRVILLIHDLERYRHMKDKNSSLGRKLRFRAEEKTLIYASSLIVHNDKMKADLAGSGIDDKKMVSLEIFDYLAAEADTAERKNAVDMPLIVAGNLSKAKSGYLYELPDNTEFNLFGMGYSGEPKPNINIKGSFKPEELPSKLDGSFGLVWDGPSAESCIGATGEYLKINNPHKTSLYLASGIPVAIWKEAALAKLIEENGCGITLENIGEAKEKAEKISPEEYGKMVGNTRRIGAKLRAGYYLKTAISKAIDMG